MKFTSLFGLWCLLAAYAVKAQLPFCQCESFALESIPGNAQCILVTDTACANSGYSDQQCCQGLRYINKLMLQVKPACNGTVADITVDGLVRSGWTWMNNVLTVRNLTMNMGQRPRPALTLCVRTRAITSCANRVNSLYDVCQSNLPLTCAYAITEDQPQRCDAFNVQLYPPPPSPRPPSPSPKPPSPSPPPPPPPPSPPLPPPPPPSEPDFPPMPDDDRGGNLPPPPSPITNPPGFPWCKCNRNAPSELMLVPVASSPTNATQCWRLDNSGITNCSGPCCDFPITKVEFVISDACRHAVEAVSVNGMRRPPQNAMTTTGRSVTKIVNVNALRAQSGVDGLEVCLHMRAPCATLDTLCAHPQVNPSGRCAYALFEEQRSGLAFGDCCVVG